jgi:hypothetical protein
MKSLFSVLTLETRFGLRVGVGASRFQAKFRSIRTGPFDEKLSTKYKLDIPIRGDDLKSCIGRFPTGSARWPEVLSSETKGASMNAKNPTFWISACVVALLAEPGVTQAQTRADADVVAVISNLENDAVKADLAGNAAFYQKFLAEEWTRGDSDGTFYTKTQIVDLLADQRTLRQTARSFLNSKCTCTATRPWQPTRIPMTL